MEQGLGIALMSQVVLIFLIKPILSSISLMQTALHRCWLHILFFDAYVMRL